MIPLLFRDIKLLEHPGRRLPYQQRQLTGEHLGEPLKGAPEQGSIRTLCYCFIRIET